MKASLANILKACDERGIPARVVRRVVRELGGVKAAAGTFHDVTRGGANAGFSSFIYHPETAAFVRAHRSAILEMLGALALGLGESVIDIVRRFNCLLDMGGPGGANFEYSTGEVGRALYGRVCDAEAAIVDALAWYALEEVARAWVDAGGKS